jgi:uncharacterized protein
MDQQLVLHRNEITQLCEKLGVRSMVVFGSAASDTSSQSPGDYDFLVELYPDKATSRARRWVTFAEELESLLGKPVDLVSPASIRNSEFAKAIASQQVVLYERSEARL